MDRFPLSAPLKFWIRCWGLWFTLCDYISELIPTPLPTKEEEAEFNKFRSESKARIRRPSYKSNLN